MSAGPAYPTSAHARAAEAIVGFFEASPETEAVLLINSCARGTATPDSCLDLYVLVPPSACRSLDEDWRRFRDSSDAVAELERAGRFTETHLDVGGGTFRPGPIRDEGELDSLELAVGNLLAYSRPLFVRGDRLARLRAAWLPFYDESLRGERLRDVRRDVLGDLERIPWFLDRGLSFQAFDRLYRAFQAFLLGLHVSRRTYPIAYNKWIREQVAGNLGLPELYERLPRLLELRRLESRELEEKASELGALLESYVAD